MKVYVIFRDYGKECSDPLAVFTTMEPVNKWLDNNKDYGYYKELTLDKEPE